MINKDTIKSLKQNNRGSSLVIVIIVITFISIMATVLLYISGMNYYMKVTDMKTKENFYTAESALEEVKAGLCSQICAKAAEDAYVDTMVMYTVASSYSRYETFQNVYFTDLKKKWNDEVLNSGSAQNLIRSFVSSTYASNVTVTGSGVIDESEISRGYVYLRGIVVELQNAEGYTTQISTDFVFTVPEMNWAVSASYTTPGESSAESVTERTTYDISEYVNYANWVRQ